jgi:hypothetical protein
MMSRYSSDSGAGITIYQMSPQDVRMLKNALENVTDFDEVLFGSDPIDQAFKFKINGGIWSPPMGTEK